MSNFDPSMIRCVSNWKFVVPLFASLCLVLTGCPPTDNGGTGGTGREFITVGTGASGGAFGVVGNAITNVIEANKGDLNWVITSAVSKGTQQNIRDLESGEIQFGMANAAISYFAVKGEGKWEQPQQIRAVGTLAPNIALFVATEGSGINSISDLKGKRVVLGPPGAGFEYFLRPLLEAHGVTYEEIEVLNGNYSSAGDMLSDGKADAAFMGGAHPIQAIVALMAKQTKIKFVPLEKAALEKLKEYPFYFEANIKAGKYADQDQDLFGINVGNMQMLTHASVDEDVVYHFTKLLYEHREQITQSHPAGKSINPKNVIRDVGTPFHPGAIKYFKEAGIWPEK